MQGCRTDGFRIAGSSSSADGLAVLGYSPRNCSCSGIRDDLW